MRELFSRIHQLEHSQPGLTAETWVERQPVRKLSIAGRTLVVTQPSSSFWVYALGVLGCVVGVYFWRLDPAETVLQLWALGLVLWGVGALIAGTSYQAFGYHLKCRDGRVRWTNWWEAIYMVLQQLSVDALFAATVLLTTSGTLEKLLLVVAGVIAVGFTGLTLAAALIPHRFLLSFEWMSLVCAPLVFAMLGLHAQAAIRTGDSLDWALTGVWIGLLACMVAYALYYKSGLTERLWERGRWFSDNDVLHVTLILWFFGIAATGSLFLDRLTA